ncbi:MAG: methyltransferase domain-containing protein [Pacificimonas sp.]
MGPANGGDVQPLAPRVDGFTCIEPARAWWCREIGGKPADYRAPQSNGDIDLIDSSAGIATALGVLHHIPNVTHVLSEIVRILKPGGYLLLREPISWMGDWRQPRRGATRHERGLPLPWLRATMRDLGLDTVKEIPCLFGPLARTASRAGLVAPYRSSAFTRLDGLLCRMTAANSRYRRTRLWHKLAPGAVAAVYKKPV